MFFSLGRNIGELEMDVSRLDKVVENETVFMVAMEGVAGHWEGSGGSRDGVARQEVLGAMSGNS